MDSVEAIVFIFVGFFIRQILGGGSIFNIRWMYFVILLIATFVIVDHLPTNYILDNTSDKWLRMILKNMSIVGIEKMIYT